MLCDNDTLLLPRNRQVLRVVRDRLGKVPQPPVRVPDRAPLFVCPPRATSSPPLRPFLPLSLPSSLPLHSFSALSLTQSCLPFTRNQVSRSEMRSKNHQAWDDRERQHLGIHMVQAAPPALGLSPR